MELIDWQAPGPYRVAFTTRLGGVSEAPYASLNLSVSSGDDPARVTENRRLLARAVGADPRRVRMAWQQHGNRVVAARSPRHFEPRQPLPRCDGLWTARPRLAMSLITADCLPIAVCRVRGAPALALLHAGWRGLTRGIVAEGCRALGGGTLAAAIGPGIGPCCYRVGEDVAEPFRQAYGEDVAVEGRLDLWTVAERALRACGCETIMRTDACTHCDERRFFSHRRDGPTTGRQGVIGYVDA